MIAGTIGFICQVVQLAALTATRIELASVRSIFYVSFAVKSPVVKPSILLNGHKTSVSLGQAFWSCIKEISKERGVTLSKLVSEIGSNRQQGNLSSAIRLYVLDYFKSRISAAPDPRRPGGD